MVESVDMSAATVSFWSCRGWREGGTGGLINYPPLMQLTCRLQLFLAGGVEWCINPNLFIAFYQQVVASLPSAVCHSPACCLRPSLYHPAISPTASRPQVTQTSSSSTPMQTCRTAFSANAMPVKIAMPCARLPTCLLSCMALHSHTLTPTPTHGQYIDYRPCRYTCWPLCIPTAVLPPLQFPTRCT